MTRAGPALSRSICLALAGLGRRPLGLFRSCEAFFFPETRAWPVNLGISGGRLGCRQGVLPGQVCPRGLAGAHAPSWGAHVQNPHTRGEYSPPCFQGLRAPIPEGRTGSPGPLSEDGETLALGQPPTPSRTPAPQRHHELCAESRSKPTPGLFGTQDNFNKRKIYVVPPGPRVHSKAGRAIRAPGSTCRNPAGVLSSHPLTVPRSEVSFYTQWKRNSEAWDDPPKPSSPARDSLSWV